MNRSTLLTLALVVLCIAACEREPDELMIVVGKIVDPSGAPIRGATVELLRNGSLTCDLGNYGYQGPIELDAGAYLPFRAFESNDAGDFLFELTAREASADELQYRSTACFQVVAAGPDYSSLISLRHPRDDAFLLPLPTGGAAPVRVGEGARGPTISGAGPSLEDFDSSVDGWAIRSGAAYAFVTEERANVLEVSPEWLEDFTELTVRRETVAINRPRIGEISHGGFLEYSAEIRGPTLGLSAGTSAIPLSRGAYCEPFLTSFDDAGTCLLTDGKLESVDAMLTSTEIRIDLGSPRPIQRVIIRGLRMTNVGSLEIEVSADQFTWIPIGGVPVPEGLTYETAYFLQALRRYRGGGLFADVSLTPSTARYLRLTGREVRNEESPVPSSPMQFFGALEISVF